MQYNHRIEQLNSFIASLGCEAILIENHTNILYLTGLELSAGKLVISSKENALIVDGRYIEICQQNKPSSCEVYLLDGMSLKHWIELKKIKKLGFESDCTLYQGYVQLQESLQGVDLIPLESAVKQLRLIKDSDELKILTEAASLGYAGYEFVLSQLREGISEAEIAVELEYFWRKKGAKKVAFDPIIAFGANSSMPHYRAGSTRLKKGMSVLIDIGVTWKHYHSDMTRVEYFGAPPEEIKKIYGIVEQAKEKALSLCKPGTRVGELDAIARGFIADAGYGEYFTHSLGHGLGLEVHEKPIIREKGVSCHLILEPHMVITIEPGIYLPGIGGVRLEDTIVITADGYKNLTK